jgi:hypothetical protein
MDGETDWYPAHIKPVRKGSYKVRNRPGSRIGKMLRLSEAKYRYWNGKEWRTYKGGPRSIMGWCIFHEWKGLTK